MEDAPLPSHGGQRLAKKKGRLSSRRGEKVDTRRFGARAPLQPFREPAFPSSIWVHRRTESTAITTVRTSIVAASPHRSFSMKTWPGAARDTIPHHSATRIEPAVSVVTSTNANGIAVVSA